MRVTLILMLAVGLKAEPLRWAELPPAMRLLLREGGLAESSFSEWQARHREASAERLAAGAAEHIAYFLLQSRRLIAEPPLYPAVEARRHRGSFSHPVRRRMDAFWNTRPATERHRVLREMAARLGWPPEKIVLTAFRFLMQRSDSGDADTVYQSRGLSADPFPPSMRGVERGLAWLRGRRAEPIGKVLLVGPGAELGSRFGVDDSQPVISPQPAALLALLAKRPSAFDCIDIRPEVASTLAGGPCRASTLDIAVDRIGGGPYDLAVATNVFVYLNDTELAMALANVAGSLRPGGCLLHNDSRFAARLFGESAGMPMAHFHAVPLGSRNGREQMDRIVVHCIPM